MSTRTITFTSKNPDGTARANATYTFRLVTVGATNVDSYPRATIRVTTDAVGAGSVVLATPDEDDGAWVYEVSEPDGYAYRLNIGYSDTSVTLEALKIALALEAGTETPTPGTLTALLDAAGFEATVNKGAVDGYASLDGAGTVPQAQLPAIDAATVGGVAEGAMEKVAQKDVASGYAGLNADGLVKNVPFCTRATVSTIAVDVNYVVMRDNNLPEEAWLLVKDNGNSGDADGVTSFAASDGKLWRRAGPLGVAYSEWAGAVQGAANDSTDAILALLDTRGAAESLKRVHDLVLGRGNYFVRGGDVVYSGALANSLILRGRSSGNGTNIRPYAATALPLVTFGDGTKQDAVRYTEVKDIAFNGLDNDIDGLFFLNGSFFNALRNVSFDDWGNGVGFKARGGAEETNNLIMDAVYAVGTGNGEGGGVPPEGLGVAYDIEMHRSLVVVNGNAEVCQIGYKLYGAGGLALAHFLGPTTERLVWAAWLKDITAHGTFCSHTGQVRFGQGCVGGNITFDPLSPRQLKAGLSVLGWGNRIQRIGNCPVDEIEGVFDLDDTSVRGPQINLDGQEWHRTPSPVSRAGWLDVNDWTPTNMTLRSVAMTLPGLKGRGLRLTPTANNGYATSSMPCEAETDYVMQLAFVLNDENNDVIKIRVRDGGGNLIIEDTPNYEELISNRSRYRIWRKRLRSVAANTSFSVELESTLNERSISLLYAGLHTSEIDFIVGGSVGGAGATSADDTSYDAGVQGNDYPVYTATLNETVGMLVTVPNVSHWGGAIVRVVANVVSGTGRIGVGGTSGDASATSLYRFADDAEYEEIFFTPRYPNGGQIKVYNLDGAGVVEIKELSVHRYYDERRRERSSVVSDSNLSADSNRIVEAVDTHGWVVGGAVVLGSANTGTGSDYWTADVRIERSGSTIQIGSVASNQSASWGQRVRIPITARAEVQPGDVVYVHFEKVGSPSALIAPLAQVDIERLNLAHP